MKKKKAKRTRVRCQVCGYRRLCKNLPTIDESTEKLDGGHAYFCSPCENRG